MERRKRKIHMKLSKRKNNKFSIKEIAWGPNTWENIQ
jgi:hypothetical protein